MSDGGIELNPTELEAFIEEYMELGLAVQRPQGIYSIIRGPRERKYQYTLKYFLDPQKPHGFGYDLLETFLDCIGFHEFHLTGQHIEIEDEVRIADDGEDGRIDLVICGGSSLSDHPRWAVFLELKVGAEEGDDQTTKYAKTNRWNFDWFETDQISIDGLKETKYLYVKRNTAAKPADVTGTFEPLDWSDIAEHFETEIQDSIFNYPHRSVIQFTDFMQSLKETEGMDSSINEDELTERLNLYFEHRDLIQQIEKANSQFESDFEQLSTYLQDNWERKLTQKYDFEESGWKVSPSTDPKWQGILPEYWEQDPLDRSSTIKLYFRHSPTTDSLRNQTLTFRLRLPPARNVHTEKRHGNQSFNDVFTEKCTTEFADRLDRTLDSMDVDKTRLGSASTLIEKRYPLDPNNIASSYFEQLDIAVEEFCTQDDGFLDLINAVFEDTYTVVFDKEPEGEFPGALPERG